MPEYQGLQDLEIYREIYINGKPVETQLISGDITVDMDFGKISTAKFSLYNESGEIPVIVNPIRDSRSMIGQKVEIFGGYSRHRLYTVKAKDTPIRSMFKGSITNCGLRFNQQGRVIATFEAYGTGYTAGTILRNEVYPTTARTDDPIKDSKGVVVRNAKIGDSRSWAIKSTGDKITLKDVITGILDEYNIVDREIVVPDVSFTTRHPLIQKNQTDWRFLTWLADEYACLMKYDEIDNYFYFVEKAKILDEKLINAGTGQEIGEKPEFYFHRYSEETPFTLAPNDRLDPTLRNAALVMKNVDFRWDATSIQGGFISQSFNDYGDLTLTAVSVQDDGKLSYEKLAIRRDLLTTPAADKFMRDYKVGETTWEDTKQFWKSQNVVIQHNPISRDNPPLNMEANLTFETLGCVYIVPMVRYPVYNLGFGDANGVDKYYVLCLGVTHTLGTIFTTNVKMMAL